ncbi:hypothetical protein H483_0112195 [Dietzia sp. UCD-THP]|uniref:hypothetical protein n=1 Tax=Dietzia sp. UCD-THP TaxID=1292020 RepID=UPI00037E28EA|nr:hypothetical protein [Dietzia sp. UCD-THP]EYT61933.1 hypothetical protein H483_0112195 [Dietzia sp. UCD-THP]
MSQGDQPGDQPGDHYGHSADPTARFTRPDHPDHHEPTERFPAQGPDHSSTDQWVASAAGAAGQTARRVQSMPWQERLLRLPGVLAVTSGVFALLSCLFPWWALFDRSGGSLIEYSVAPFRGVSASSGSRWSDMAAINTLDQDDLEVARVLTVSVGLALVVAAVTLIAGGILIARGRMQAVGISLILFGAVTLGYARVPSEIVGNVSDAASDISSAIGAEFSLVAELVGSMVPEARLGLGLSTFALTLAALGIIVYLVMIAYRETIRITRWIA